MTTFIKSEGYTSSSFFLTVTHEVRLRIINVTNANYNYITIKVSTTDVAKKKSHFVTPKTYFIILPHHFTTSHLSDILSFNSVH